VDERAARAIAIRHPQLCPPVVGTLAHGRSERSGVHLLLVGGTRRENNTPRVREKIGRTVLVLGHDIYLSARGVHSYNRPGLSEVVRRTHKPASVRGPE